MDELEYATLKNAVIEITGALLDQSLVNSAIIGAILRASKPSGEFYDIVRKAQERDKELLATIEKLVVIVQALEK